MNQHIQDQHNNRLDASNKLPVISPEEISATYNLLRDFGINIKKSDIPCNVTIFDLHLWRRSKIKAYLQG